MATRIPFNHGTGSIPTIGLGTWTCFWQEGTKEEFELAVSTAIDVGYRHIDCAWGYNTQPEVGNVLARKIKDGVVKREDIFLTTKLWSTHHRPDRVKEELQDTLKDLQTDYVDMFLIHWPTSFLDQDLSREDLGPADETGKVIPADYKIEDVWKAMEECQRAGLAKNIGVSNFNGKQLDRIMKCCTIKPANVQVEVSVYYSNSRLVELCQSLGIVVTGYAPLGASYNPLIKEAKTSLFEDDVLKAIAEKKGKTVAQVVLRSLVQRGLAVIPKSIHPNRIKENVQVFDFSLSEDEMQAIANLNKNFKSCIHPIPNTSHHPEFPFNEDL